MRPPWFSKPASTARLAGLELDLDRDVADQPRPVRADRAQVDQADAGQRLVAELVGVPEQLVAAAHGEDHAAAVGDLVERVALDLGEIERAQPLVAVLAAADVEQVGAVGVELVAEAAARAARSRSRASAQRRSSSSRLPRSA